MPLKRLIFMVTLYFMMQQHVAVAEEYYYAEVDIFIPDVGHCEVVCLVLFFSIRCNYDKAYRSCRSLGTRLGH